MIRAEELIARVLQAHATLCGERDLSPRNPRINKALGLLVNGIMAGCDPDDVRGVLECPAVRAVRSELLGKLALAEGEMESYWSGVLCARAGLTAADLKDFEYWDCYRHLVRQELACLPPDLKPDAGRTIAFVGAGPLPLSAILMHLGTGVKLTCIDADPHACRQARTLCARLGLAGIDVRCADGVEWDYAQSGVVLVASLVPEKAKVVARIQATGARALVGLRSAEGLCTLLYDPVDEAELEAMGCVCIARTGNDPGVINNTLFCEAARGGRTDAIGTRSRGGLQDRHPIVIARC